MACLTTLEGLRCSGSRLRVPDLRFYATAEMSPFDEAKTRRPNDRSWGRYGPCADQSHSLLSLTDLGPEGGADEILVDQEVVQIFVRRQDSSGPTLHNARQAHRDNHPSTELPSQEYPEDLAQ